MARYLLAIASLSAVIGMSPQAASASQRFDFLYEFGSVCG
jgi:hypothetical protein